MAEENQLAEINKKVDSLTNYMMRVSENILNNLEKPLLKEEKADPGQQDKMNKMAEQITRMSKTLQSIEDQMKFAKTSAPPQRVNLSRKIIALCAVVSLSMTLLSVVSMYFLTRKNTYELSSKEILTCRKGSMLEKAWPRLTPKEREKITGVPPAPSKPTRH